MPNKILFLEDLYDFYSSKYKKSTHFNSAEHGDNPIVVQIHGNIKFDAENKDTEGLCPVHLQACHTGINLNQSNIDDSVMQENLGSFKNRPILGYIHKVITEENPDGQWEFYSHNIHEENGEIVYDEVPIGLIPESCNAQIVYDEEKGKNYVEVDGYLFEEYSRAVDILKREQECAVSVELSIRELSYNAKDKYLNIESFYFSGVTILGRTPSGQKVQPGMENSNIKLADFSEKNNSFFANYSDKIDQLQQKVDQLLSRFDKENFKEGGNDSQMNKFEELLRKYNKTVEDITFEYEKMSDEELEQKFAELFDEEGSGTGEINTGEGDTTSENESGENPSENGETDGSESEQFEKMIRTYEISHEDIRYALYGLLAPFEDSDNEWYFITNVYDSYFVYENWEGTKIYRQEYTKDGDNISFEGERIELFKELLTASEKAELDAMRSNYAALVEFKETTEKNELHVKREEILSNEKYSSISEKDENGNYINESFGELVKNMDNYSLEDLEKEAKIIFADSVEVGTFSVDNKKVNVCGKIFANVNNSKKPSRYGNLFSK